MPQEVCEAGGATGENHLSELTRSYMRFVYPCPICGAERGKECERLDFNDNFVVSHRARLELYKVKEGHPTKLSQLECKMLEAFYNESR